MTKELLAEELESTLVISMIHSTSETAVAGGRYVSKKQSPCTRVLDGQSDGVSGDNRGSKQLAFRVGEAGSCLSGNSTTQSPDQAADRSEKTCKILKLGL